MSDSSAFANRSVAGTATPSLPSVAGLATVLVVVNVLLMLGLSYTPVAGIGTLLFSNFFLGIATFVVTVGGGYWLSSRGVERGNFPLAVVGVGLIQVGYGLFGAAILAGASSALRVPALGITAVITGLITAGITVVVFSVDHSFERWQLYSGALFLGGFAIGAIGVFVANVLLVVAGLCFFLGFVTDLTYEIWAVKENRYSSTFRNAIGIYVAVMGVFVHILMWVLRAMEFLDI